MRSSSVTRAALFCAVVICLLASVAGCGVASARAGSDGLSTARDAYVALVTPLNARVGALSGRVDAANGDTRELRRISGDYAALEADFAAGVRAIEFPADLAPTVSSALDAVDRVGALNERLTTADGDAALSIGDELSAALDQQRARLSTLRERLGLGELPNG